MHPIQKFPMNFCGSTRLVESFNVPDLISIVLQAVKSRVSSKCPHVLAFVTSVPICGPRI